MTSDFLFLDVMRTGLTAVYDRGMERLAVPLTADGDGTLRPRYGLAAYRARYGRDPEAPRFLLAPRRDTIEPLTVEVSFTRSPGGPEQTAELRFPAGWPGGAPAAIELPGTAAEFTAGLRITRLRPQPPAPAAPEDWQLSALLGTLARLLWTIGQDHQDLAHRFTDVARQRSAESASGAGLDLLGQDLGAPRFPPRRHGADEATFVLHHLDDQPPADHSPLTKVADAGDRQLPSEVTGAARGGQAGRFGRAFGFPAEGGAVTVADSADFGGTGDFTVEAVVRPDPAATDPGAVLAKRSSPGGTAAPGWALTLGSHRGIDHNPRFTLTDGTTTVDLFADRDLADGRFHHLAVTLRRTPAGALARLHLDGAEADRRLAPLGALDNSAAVVIGQETAPDGTQYVGLIEEVRLSTTARTSFAPVTGESDEQYRRRLRVFQRWLVPTPDNLTAVLNRTAGPVRDHAGGTPRDVPDAFVLDETTARITTGSTLLRVLPPPLTAGQSITAVGDRLRTEAQTVGTAEDEPDFDPAWLCRHEDRADRLGFDGDDGARLMQLPVRRALDALLDRLTGQPGTLVVRRAYDPAAPATDGPFAVGRALSLHHTVLDSGRLGVHAHAAGFAWVGRTADDLVHAAQPPGEVFAITLVGGDDQDLTALHSVELALDPPVTAFTDAAVRWTVTGTGPGSATVEPGPAGHAVLHLLTPGDVTVGVEVSRAGHTRGGRRALRIGPPDDQLAPGRTIGRDGRIGATEAAAAGTVTDDFDLAHLQLRTDDLATPPARVSYGTATNHRRMQPAASAALDRLLAGLGGQPGTLSVLDAYTPGDQGLAGQGRVLRLRHDTRPGGPPPLSGLALAARAFAAGFDHIEVQAPASADAAAPVRVAVAAGDQLTVTITPAEVTVGQSATAAVEPGTAPAAACCRPDGGRFYLTDRGTHRTTAYALAADSPDDLPTLTPVASTVTAPFPVAMAFVGGRLFVAHEHGPVHVLDETGPETLNSSRFTIDAPTTLATDGTRLYVGLAGSPSGGSVRDHDPLTGNLTSPGVLLPGVPGAIAAHPAGPLLAVLLDGGRFCWVTRPAGPVVGAAVTIEGATRATCAAFDPAGTRLYIGAATGADGPGSGIVQVYKTGDRKPSSTLTAFPPGTVPVAMSAANDQKHLYVATSGNGPVRGRVHVVDLTTGALLPLPLATDGDCRALAASPAGAPHRPCLFAAPEHAGRLLLADQGPLADDPPGPPRLVSRHPLAPGRGTTLAWSTLPAGPGRAEPASPDAPVTPVTADAAGPVRLRAAYLKGGPPLPYQCEVRLRDGLDGRPEEVVISKEQYDLVLNILNWFHPIGVEFRTDRLRPHVRELAGAVGDTDLLPDYTFPTYHTYDFPLPFLLRPGKEQP
ncbi:LamG-like jellyroll fold domain-containing protein [Kitasatospora sp. NPDC127111]|uniref:LamG-like jellyroll fold domain-containing protein n=1 Tax=Kitasatospora sp. NPDC127111 TaxID=3345363 RepID=UPI00362CEE64